MEKWYLDFVKEHGVSLALLLLLCLLVVVLVLVKFQKKSWASYLFTVGAARLVVGKISNNLAGGPPRPADRIIVYHTIRPLSAH